MTGKISASRKGFHNDQYRALIQALIDQRKALGWSQQQFANALGRHQQFVSRYEIGERRLDIVEFVEIAQALKLDIISLIRTIL